jgi:hypothetical protein
VYSVGFCRLTSSGTDFKALPIVSGILLRDATEKGINMRYLERKNWHYV